MELEVKIHQKIKKESTSKVVELKYIDSQKLLGCLSGDNKIEFFKVNIDNHENILKKMVRTEKRRALKRKRTDMEESGDELPTEKKIDKSSLKEKIKNGDYDLSMHFSKRSIIEIE